MADPRVVQENDAFDAKVSKSDINKTIEALVLGARRMKYLFIFEAVLTLVLGYVFIRQSVSNAQIQNNHNALVSSCLSGNDFRKTNLALWEYILSIPPQEPPTPEQKKVAATFKVYVEKTFAPRDCSQIK